MRNFFQAAAAAGPASTAAQPGGGAPADMDMATILATFPPEVREEVLLTSDDSLLANLTPALLAEAQVIPAHFFSGYPPYAIAVGRLSQKCLQLCCIPLQSTDRAPECVEDDDSAFGLDLRRVVAIMEAQQLVRWMPSELTGKAHVTALTGSLPAEFARTAHAASSRCSRSRRSRARRTGPKPFGRTRASAYACKCPPFPCDAFLRPAPN